MGEPEFRAAAVPRHIPPHPALIGWACVAAAFCLLFGGMMLLLAGRDLGGPVPVTPDRSAIIGTWRSHGGAEIIFRRNGTYTASGMPRKKKLAKAYHVPAWTVELPADGRGTWVVAPWDGSSGSGGGVDLTDRRGSGIELTTSGNPAHPALFGTIYDPDEGNYYYLTKQPG